MEEFNFEKNNNKKAIEGDNESGFDSNETLRNSIDQHEYNTFARLIKDYVQDTEESFEEALLDFKNNFNIEDPQIKADLENFEQLINTISKFKETYSNTKETREN
jgi:ABC-type transporter Mla subunit MlaD